jgi:hypothetical protein
MAPREDLPRTAFRPLVLFDEVHSELTKGLDGCRIDRPDLCQQAQATRGAEAVLQLRVSDLGCVANPPGIPPQYETEFKIVFAEGSARHKASIAEHFIGLTAHEDSRLQACAFVVEDISKDRGCLIASERLTTEISHDIFVGEDEREKWIEVLGRDSAQAEAFRLDDYAGHVRSNV